MIEAKAPACKIALAGSKVEAEAALASSDYFDLIILDLRIPTELSLPTTADTQHGQAVLDMIRRRAPAAVVRVLTAYPLSMDDVSKYINRFAIKDVYKDLAALEFVGKHDMMRIGDIVDEIQKATDYLHTTIELVTSGAITIQHRRLLLQYADLCNAARINMAVFSTGASGAVTSRVDLYDVDGSPCGNIVAKIDALAAIDRERSNYNQYVATQLEPGSVPHVSGDRLGVYDRFALFYRLARDYPFNVFTYLKQFPDNAENLIRSVEAIDNGWLGNVVVERESLEQLLGRFNVLQQVSTLPDALKTRVQALLTTRVRFRKAAQHSDLHGENILVSKDGKPLLIDFGRVGQLLAPVDAVMLELSFILHPGAAALRGSWPTVEQARHWSDVTAFTRDTPMGPALCECRNWANRVVENISTKAIYATALGHCLWQIKLGTVNKPVAMAIAESALDALEKVEL